MRHETVRTLSSQLSAKRYYSQSEECLLHAPASSMHVVPEAETLGHPHIHTRGGLSVAPTPTLLHFKPGVSAEFATLTSFVFKINLLNFPQIPQIYLLVYL